MLSARTLWSAMVTLSAVACVVVVSAQPAVASSSPDVVMRMAALARSSAAQKTEANAEAALTGPTANRLIEHALEEDHGKLPPLDSDLLGAALSSNTPRMLGIFSTITDHQRLTGSQIKALRTYQAQLLRNPAVALLTKESGELQRSPRLEGTLGAETATVAVPRGSDAPIGQLTVAAFLHTLTSAIAAPAFSAQSKTVKAILAVPGAIAYLRTRAPSLLLAFASTSVLESSAAATSTRVVARAAADFTPEQQAILKTEIDASKAFVADRALDVASGLALVGCAASVVCAAAVIASEVVIGSIVVAHDLYELRQDKIDVEGKYHPASLELMATRSKVAAGETDYFTVDATDKNGADVGPVSFTLSVDPALGACVKDECTFRKAGSVMVEVSSVNGDAHGDTTVNVVHNRAFQLELLPVDYSIAPGQPATYAVQGEDDYGNKFSLTSETLFTVDGQPCDANVCTATAVGPHTIVASYGELHDTTTLTVTASGGGSGGGGTGGSGSHVYPTSATMTVDGYEELSSKAGLEGLDVTVEFTPREECDDEHWYAEYVVACVNHKAVTQCADSASSCNYEGKLVGGTVFGEFAQIGSGEEPCQRPASSATYFAAGLTVGKAAYPTSLALSGTGGLGVELSNADSCDAGFSLGLGEDTDYAGFNEGGEVLVPVESGGEKSNFPMFWDYSLGPNSFTGQAEITWSW